MGITLTRKETKFKHRNNCRRAWSMEVTAVSDLPELDANIFVYHAVEPEDPEESDSFSNVASLQDMSIIPVDAPAQLPNTKLRENFIPYYRKSSVVMDFYNAADMERAWRIMKLDTDSLVREYYAARRMHETEVVSFDGDGAVKATPREILALDVHTSSLRVDEATVALMDIETDRLESATNSVINSISAAEISQDDFNDIKYTLEGLCSRTEGSLQLAAHSLRELAQRPAMPHVTAEAMIAAAGVVDSVADIVAARTATATSQREVYWCSRTISQIKKDIAISDFMKARLSAASVAFSSAIGDEAALMQALGFVDADIAKLTEIAALIAEDVNRLI